MFIPLEETINFLKQTGRKIAIWGAKDRGNHLLKYFRTLGVCPDFFLDGDSQLQGKLIQDIEVKSPFFISDLKEKPFIFIAITDYIPEVVAKLNGDGYIENDDFLYLYQKRIISGNITDYTDINNNLIIGSPKTFNSKIILNGRNNKIYFRKNVSLVNTTITLFNNTSCTIGTNSLYKGEIILGEGCSVNIGKNLFVTNNCYIASAEYTEINIGDDCMFSTNNQIRSHDSHPIFDISTGKRLNISKSISIGNHVWLAYGAILLSGAKIGDGSVVGHSSIVKSAIPNNCIAVGAPAHIVKKNIAWEKTNLTLSYPHHFPNSDYIQDKKYWNETKE